VGRNLGNLGLPRSAFYGPLAASSGHWATITGSCLWEYIGFACDARHRDICNSDSRRPGREFVEFGDSYFNLGETQKVK
jgi:hypothetical protein